MVIIHFPRQLYILLALSIVAAESAPSPRLLNELLGVQQRLQYFFQMGTVLCPPLKILETTQQADNSGGLP